MASTLSSPFDNLCLKLKRKEIRDIHLSEYRFGPITDDMFSILLSCCSSVRKFHIQCSLSNKQMEKLSLWLQNEDHSVMMLGFETRDESNSFLESFTSTLPTNLPVDQLYIRLESNGILSHDSSQAINNWFARCTIRHMRFKICRELGLWEARQRISFLECLIHGLADNGNLQALDLIIQCGADLAEDSLERMFQRNQMLETINIEGTEELQEPFVSDFFSALKSSCRHCHIGLRNVSLNASLALFEGLATAKNIKSLFVEQLEYNDDHLDRISFALSCNDKIESLSLGAICGDAYITLTKLEASLSAHTTLKSFQIFGHDAAISREICHIVENIATRNPMIREFGFPIMNRQDAQALLEMIPRIHHLESLEIVDGSISVPLLNPDALLDALEQNVSLVRFSMYSPQREHTERLSAILQRNLKMKRRSEISKVIPQLELMPQLWPLLQGEMSNRTNWQDAMYHFMRELVLIQQCC
jgi:hypothetical protein